MAKFENIEEILERMKKIANVHKDVDLAKILGLKQSTTISDAKKEKAFPGDHLFEFSRKYKVPIDYLEHGEKRAMDDELRSLVDMIKDDHETIEVLKTIIELRKKIKDALIKLTVEVIPPEDCEKIVQARSKGKEMIENGKSEGNIL